MPQSLARDLRALPNLITLSRIGLLLVAAVVYFKVSTTAGLVLGVLAGVTDYVDGAVARATGQVTRLGEVLDQLSDLIFESTLLLFVVTAGFTSPLALCAYLLREFWVLGIRRFMAGRGLNISSGWPGKLKTNFIMWSFVPTFLSLAGSLPQLEPALGWLGHAGMWVGIALGYWSGWRYTVQFRDGYNGAQAANSE